MVLKPKQAPRERQIDPTTKEPYDAPDGFIAMDWVAEDYTPEENEIPCPLFVSPKFVERYRSMLPTRGDDGRKSYITILVGIYQAWKQGRAKGCKLDCCMTPRGFTRLHFALEGRCSEAPFRFDVVISSEGPDGRLLNGGSIAVWVQDEYKEV